MNIIGINSYSWPHSKISAESPIEWLAYVYSCTENMRTGWRIIWKHCSRYTKTWISLQIRNLKLCSHVHLKLVTYLIVHRGDSCFGEGCSHGTLNFGNYLKRLSVFNCYMSSVTIVLGIMYISLPILRYQIWQHSYLWDS